MLLNLQAARQFWETGDEILCSWNGSSEAEKNIEVPNVDLWRNELTITSSYGAASVDLKESLDLIKNKKVNVKDMITHKLPLEKIQEGFKLVTDAKESLKVVLTN